MLALFESPSRVMVVVVVVVVGGWGGGGGGGAAYLLGVSFCSWNSRSLIINSCWLIFSFSSLFRLSNAMFLFVFSSGISFLRLILCFGLLVVGS